MCPTRASQPIRRSSQVPDLGGRRERAHGSTASHNARLCRVADANAEGSAAWLGVPRATLQTAPRISEFIAVLGEKAEIVVNSATSKYASIHDLWRAFGTRWASRVKPTVLQLLMRHANIGTTMAFYVEQDAGEVAAELWEGHKLRVV